MTKSEGENKLQRRTFMRATGAAATAITAGAAGAGTSGAGTPIGTAASGIDSAFQFDSADSLVHGDGWETLNPGYWQLKNGALRRRMANYGDRARSTGFPFHYETHRRNGGMMDVNYDPSLPMGIIYRKDCKLKGDFEIRAVFRFHGSSKTQRPGDSPEWKMNRPGYGFMGVAVGARSLFESYGKQKNATLIGWQDDAQLALIAAAKYRKGKGKQPRRVSTEELKPGEDVTLILTGQETNPGEILLRARWQQPDQADVVVEQNLPMAAVDGYVGIAAQGLLDFEVTQFQIACPNGEQTKVGLTDCLTCYPLGDTLTQVDEQWQVRFVGLFASDGEQAELRISDVEHPEGGWESVPVAGAAAIINNRWRRNTASILATLPANPADTTLYYTIWKDGRNVTADARIGTSACGPGTGLVGDVPTSGNYVGRLPQLVAPYKMCGLSCHAITSGLQERTSDGFQIRGGASEWQFRDQPTVEAYKHFEDYDFQILCWEDDVWYMELVLYPPSTDDAYKIVSTTIAGPTSRWQMMRHWNVINPGDHDYGMDDVKGPEQIAIRLKDGLGQDKDYMRRNFQIVHHLITGAEQVDPLANPKKWRAWKMPNRDFTFVIVDSRLWRSSQDTAMWDDEGWGHMRELYDRADPTRSLLGEEQFAWLQEIIRTDSSRLICLTGLNGLHTVWTGGGSYSNSDQPFAQRDRVAADYAGWVAAGADRVIELLGSRDGVVTVYGDVHNGCIMKNTDHGLVECSFGPIGRSGGRAVIPGFGEKMKDFDGRPLEVTALYHKQHADPQLNRHAPGEPFYWNFLEMAFHPEKATPEIFMAIRNMIDPPDQTPRGGGSLLAPLNATGRKPSSRIPAQQWLPGADVRVVSTQGRPIRGTRTDARGELPEISLVDIAPGTSVILTAFDGDKADSRLVVTVAPT